MTTAFFLFACWFVFFLHDQLAEHDHANTQAEPWWLAALPRSL